MCGEPAIDSQTAPDDFPDALPQVPPTKGEIRQLMEVWSNVNRVNSLRVENWDGVQRSEYMLWTTEDQRQFRVIWDQDAEVFRTSERTRPL